MACQPCKRITTCLQFPLASYGITRGTTFQNGDLAYSVDCPGRDPVLVQVPAGTITLTIPYPPGEPFYPPIVLECSGSTITRNIPAFATAQQIQAVAEEMIDQCAQAFAEDNANCNQSTAFLNEEVTYIFTCDVDRSPGFSGSLPAWITSNTVLNVMTFTGAAGTFQGNSQAAANGTAQAALDGWVQQQIDEELLECTTWTPADANPAHWWDASTISGSDGDLVQTIEDLTAAQNNWLVVGGAGNPPILKVALQNGLNVVRWTTATNNAKRMSLRKALSVPPPGDLLTLLSGLSQVYLFAAVANNDVGAQHAACFSGFNSLNVSNEVRFYIRGSNVAQGYGLQYSRRGEALHVDNSSTVSTVGVWNVIMWLVDFANAQMRIDVDGTTVLSSAGADPGVSLQNAQSWLPQDTSGEQRDLGEMIFDFNALAQSEIDQYFGYLAWKWGLQGNLPPGHPYKNFPPP